MVGLWIFQINLLVGHIQIAAVDNGLAAVQRDQIVPQVILPLHAVVQPLQAVLGVWSVAAYQIEALVLQRNEASLVVMPVQVHAIGGGQRAVGGKDGGSGIALLFRGVPILQNTLPQRNVSLTALHFCLLQTEKVRRLGLIKLQKALFHTGPQAVHIPRQQFHIKYLPELRDLTQL